MTQRHLVQTWAAPLHWPSAYSIMNGELRLDELLRYAVGFQEGQQVDNLFARYREIMNREGRRPFLATPMNTLYIERIISPVKQALVQYIFGNYISAIMTAGYVGEMITILHFQMHASGSTPLKNGEGKKISLKKFEEFRQSDRCARLFNQGLISKKDRELLDKIHTQRKNYFHNLSHEWTSLKNDAGFMVGAAIDLVSTFNGNTVDDQGNLVLASGLLSFLLNTAGPINAH